MFKIPTLETEGAFQNLQSTDFSHNTISNVKLVLKISKIIS